MEDGWIPSHEVKRLLGGRGLQGQELNARIKELAAMGALRIRLSSAKKLPQQKGDAKDWEVPADWLALGSFPSDTVVIDLYRDTLAVNELRLQGRRCVDGTGLHFHADDLANNFGLEVPTTENTAAPARSKGGRKPAGGWPLFAAALGVWVQRRGDLASNIASVGSDDLLNQLDDILTSEWGEEKLPRSTFQPGAQEFLRRMQDEGRKGR